MRIGIEAQRLFRPHKHGMDRVALELIKSLQIIDQQNEYFIFVKPDKDNRVIKPTKNFKIIEVSGGPYPIWEQIKLPKLIKDYKCDILHCTGNTAPLKLKIPLIVTLHDIIFKEGSIFKLISSNASWYQKIGNLYRRIIVEKVVKKSHRIITVSNFEKNNIANNFKVDGKNLRAIHNGVNKSFSSNYLLDKKLEIRRKYNLPERFVLHIGNSDPRKNTKRVLHAFHKYTLESCSDYKLVIVGMNNAKLESIMPELHLLNDLKSNIVLTGYVSDEDLPIIFNMARLFLFPSLREGFGIPLLEAMASGIPVITSNTSSMPEVAGNAALLIDPSKTEEIYNGIEKILSNNRLRYELINKGLARSKSFSWFNAAQNVFDIYKQLYNEHKTNSDGKK
jgi:glycosyltransferase involved in cell wall biosynthesis